MLTKAVNDERDKTQQLTVDMDKLRQRNEILEKENKEREMKYVDLYMENSQQHDKIVELQN